jgi:hypothetical protein
MQPISLVTSFTSTKPALRTTADLISEIRSRHHGRTAQRLHLVEPLEELMRPRGIIDRQQFGLPTTGIMRVSHRHRTQQHPELPRPRMNIVSHPSVSHPQAPSWQGTHAVGKSVLALQLLPEVPPHLPPPTAIHSSSRHSYQDDHPYLHGVEVDQAEQRGDKPGRVTHGLLVRCASCYDAVERSQRREAHFHPEVGGTLLQQAKGAETQERTVRFGKMD